MKRVCLSLLCGGILLGSFACTTYIEQDTPPGYVPPQQDTVDNPGQAAPASRSAAVSRAPAPAAPPPAMERSSFADAYQRMGSPRIVVFGTREFSDRVNDWQPGAAIEITTEDSMGTGSGGDDLTMTSTTGITTMNAAPRQQAVFTDDELLFERSFTAELLKAGVTVIDRNVILRQESLRHQDADAKKRAILSESVVESYALNNNVELIISIDMLESIALPCINRRYLASLKDLQSGEIKATADSTESVNRFTVTEVVGTSEGYQRQTVNQPFTCADLAGALAKDLMDAMAASMR